MPDTATQMPRWRVKARQKVAPYGRVLGALTLVSMAICIANEIYGWGLFGLYGRKSEAIALLLGLLAYIFILPTPDDLKRLKESGKSLRDWRP